MDIVIKAPAFPESISEGTLATWYSKPGDQVSRDDLLASIETDKVALEIVAPADGYLTEVSKQEGDTVLSEEMLARFSAQKKTQPATPASSSPQPASSPTAPPSNPAARKLAGEMGVKLEEVQGSGKGGRITKDDVMKARTPDSRKAPEPVEETSVFQDRPEQRAPMTRLRARIAERLLEAQHSTAMLTTFNEVDMSTIVELRQKYKEEFEQAHDGTKLGFMSFFVLATVAALKKFPMVNASIDGNEIVYHGYYDIGVAVGTSRGLVVPVIKDADSLGLAQIEQTIRAFSDKARDNKLTLEDLSGGTFTISNGGIYGSLMSTPILNPPQTAILGMHKIQPRPVVIDNEVKVRPMMYLALSYDHRLIDGSEAVRFLVTIKELLEQPVKALLEI